MAAGQGMGYKVFISDLPGDCTELEVRTVFETYGQVNSIHMLSAGRDGLRSAYVYYADSDAAEDAEEVLNGVYSIRRGVDRPIRVQRQGNHETTGSMRIWTENGTVDSFKLFVGSLPLDITEEEVKMVFGTYGTVLRVHLLASHPLRGRSGFVMYSEKEAGDDAIEVLNDKYKMRPDWPYPLKVRWAKKPVLGGTTWGVNGSWEQACSTWAGNHGPWSEGSSVSWQGNDWRGSWGGSDWAEPSKGWSGSGKGRGRKGGAGRLCPTPGCKYIVTWHDTHCCSCCEWYPGDHGPGCERQLHAESWEEKGGSSASTAAAVPSGEGPSKSKSTCVHVFANLPSDIDEKSLKYVFETYGKVNSIRLQKDGCKPGQAEAFIDYGSAWDAETSLMSLGDLYEIRRGFGPLRVRFARAGAEGKPY